MSFTATTLTQIDDAIIARGLGAKRVVIGDKEYEFPSISDLMALRSLVVSDLQGSSDCGVGRFVFVNKDTM